MPARPARTLRAASIASASTQPPPSVPNGRSDCVGGQDQLRADDLRRAALGPDNGRHRERTARRGQLLPCVRRATTSCMVGRRYKSCIDARIYSKTRAFGAPMPYTLTVNGRAATVDVPADMPLLWVLRDVLNLKGTKFGCGIAQCGACTVHVDGEPTRAVLRRRSRRSPRRRSRPSRACRPTATHPLQQAWQAIDVPQCGYCQAGQIMIGRRAAREERQTDRRRHRRRDDRQPLPLRHLPAHPRRPFTEPRRKPHVAQRCRPAPAPADAASRRRRPWRPPLISIVARSFASAPSPAAACCSRST